MVTIGEALEAERERRKRETEETAEQREVGRAVLQALVQRLTPTRCPLGTSCSATMRSACCA